MIATPGEYIFSASSQDAGNDPDYFYIQKSGTSMAAPVIAGTITIMRQMNPYLSYNQILNILRNSSIVDSFVTNWGSVPNNLFGYGKVNVTDAVLNAEMPFINQTSFVSSVSGSTLKVKLHVMDLSRVKDVSFNFSRDLGQHWSLGSAIGPDINNYWSLDISIGTTTTFYFKFVASDVYGIIAAPSSIYGAAISSTTTGTTTPLTTTSSNTSIMPITIQTTSTSTTISRTSTSGFTILIVICSAVLIASVRLKKRLK